MTSDLRSSEEQPRFCVSSSSACVTPIVYVGNGIVDETKNVKCVQGKKVNRRHRLGFREYLVVLLSPAMPVYSYTSVSRFFKTCPRV